MTPWGAVLPPSEAQLAITDEHFAAARGKMASCNGHVVIRVAPNGKSYSVFVLDDEDFSYKIRQIARRRCVEDAT